MRFDKENLIEVCKFLKGLGYKARISSSFVNCDIRIPNKKIRIQIATVPSLEDKEIILFLGSKHKEKIRWRLTRSNYFIINGPLHYYVVRSKNLRKLIEANYWHEKTKYRIESRKNPKAVLIKVPKKFIIYGLSATNDIQIFNKIKNKSPLGTKILKVERGQ